MNVLTQMVVWLNALANLLGRLLDPLAYLPGWLSATLIAVVTGVVLLWMFKHTSNQKAIRKVRDGINADLLTLKLFKDSILVAFAAQGRLLVGAGRLFVLGLVPLVFMIVPVTLLLGQLALWYQQRPLQIGEQAVVTMRLAGAPGEPMPVVTLLSGEAAQNLLGPIQILSKREVCWNIQALHQGQHQLLFQVGTQIVSKELAIGDGFQRVSAQRPAWDPLEALTHPWEPPFAADSPVQAIAIDYPRRQAWTCGSDWWIVYWFIVSMLAAFAFRRVLRVNI